jgi:thiopeptide-type bacteriocin biosynthesis protein
VERHFCASSELVLSLMISPIFSEFQAGFFMAYHLINCFLADLSLGRVFTSKMVENFLDEFKANKALRTDLDGRYRSLKEDLTVLIEDPDRKNVAPELFKAFERLAGQTKDIAAVIIDKPDGLKGKLIADLVHMHLNRAFRVNQRQQELLVYYCLHKYFISRIARRKRMSHSD